MKAGESKHSVEQYEECISRRHTQTSRSTSEGASTSSAADTVGFCPANEALQAEWCITDVLGQLTGKMLCEIFSEETALITESNYGLIGFAVQCTQASKVQNKFDDVYMLIYMLL